MNYLLASHGSPGAMAAEAFALKQCQSGDCLDHLLVIPQWWQDMTGDDWLNNGVSRNRYRDFIEQQLGDESEQVFTRLQKKCELAGIQYLPILKIGKTSKVFESAACDKHYARIFVGTRRPRTCDGVNDRMLTKKIINNKKYHLVMVKHPYASCLT